MEELLQAKRNQVKMMKVRGYDIGDEELILNMSLDELQTYYAQKAKAGNTTIRKTMTTIYQKPDVKNLVMYLDTSGKSQLGVGAIATFIAEARKNNCNQGIIISPQPATKEALEDLRKTTESLVQFFLEIELNYDILGHVLQPRFQVLDKKQAEEFFKLNRINPHQMPVIKNFDPVARYLGLEPGSVIKEYNRTLSGETLVDEYVTFSYID